MGKSLAFYLDPDAAWEAMGSTGRPNRRNISGPKGGCEGCVGKDFARAPRIPGFGEKTGLVIVGEGPGDSEDRQGIPFVGATGRYLREVLVDLGIHMDKDCFRTNALQCYIPKVKKTKQVLEKCRANCLHRLEAELHKLEPKLILCFGGPAVKSVLSPPFGTQISKLRGRLIPSQKYQCWVACLLHPSYILRQVQIASDFGQESDMPSLFRQDLKNALRYLDIPIDEVPYLNPGEFEYVTDADEAIRILERLSRSDRPVGFDYETSHTQPFKDDFTLLSVGLAVESEDEEMSRWFIPLDYRGHWADEQLESIYNALRGFLQSDCKKVCQAMDFEYKASVAVLGVKPRNIVHDTMVGEHVRDERKGCCSLEFQVFTSFGVTYKKGVSFKNKSHMTALDCLPSYNALDAGYTLHLYKKQVRELLSIPSVYDAYQFFHTVVPVLSRMSEAGIKVDRVLLEKMQSEAEEETAILLEDLANQPCVADLAEARKKEVNLLSNDDVKTILYDVLGLTTRQKTEGGDYSVNEKALSGLLGKKALSTEARVFITAVLRLRKLCKFSGTYTKNLLDLSDERGHLHPSYHLHVAETYRSSSSDPNWQNQPIRDPEMKKIRRAVVPLHGDLFLEADYAGAEVRVLAMYSQDKTLTTYLNEGVDFHRIWASRIFAVPEADVTDEQRFQAKNLFVFPSFYGAIPASIAHNLGMDVGDIAILQGVLFQEFPGVKKWQEGVLEEYFSRGYVSTFMGFRRRAPLSINKVINMPIQATASHLLFDGLVRADDLFTEFKFGTRLVAQIHDSALSDTVESELEDVFETLRACLETKRFDWEGKVKMKCDWKVGYNWFDMEELL